MSGRSNAAGSFICSPSSGNWTRSQSQSRSARVSKWCGYDCRPVLRWSGTESNPNKLLFGCPNYNVDIGQDEGVGIADSDRANDKMNMNLA
ncbi:hypothetical protein Ahy_B02g059107 [Arachis hypogaea]|uniref:Uncharacterized protein n=1 Tax=Arachis hypogaea TaxID=3818 RepID=A0A445AG60_ARAHY|nr:hypothetical protein Ahy_B02g059107 [Arachis hypogaea]